VLHILHLSACPYLSLTPANLDMLVLQQQSCREMAPAETWVLSPGDCLGHLNPQNRRGTCQYIPMRSHGCCCCL
jgi:hypothetical protein